ncbi:MAG: DUF2946 domain-containing protein [Burkholderiaceae bacterium]
MACVAILMAALGPAMSQGLQSSAAPDWEQICTSLGPASLHLGDNTGRDPSPTAPSRHQFKHCPSCSMHMSGLGLPPEPAASLPTQALTFLVPQLFLVNPRTLFAWVTAQPRAPPRSC